MRYKNAMKTALQFGISARPVVIRVDILWTDMHQNRHIRCEDIRSDQFRMLRSFPGRVKQITNREISAYVGGGQKDGITRNKCIALLQTGDIRFSRYAAFFIEVPGMQQNFCDHIAIDFLYQRIFLWNTQNLFSGQIDLQIVVRIQQ